MLWTIGFASKKFKQITQIIAVSAVFNVIANRLLIPVWGGNGAAISFLATTILQLIGYHRMVSKHFMKFSSVSFFILLFTGIVAYFAALKATDNILGQLVISVGIYILVAIVSKQVRKQHLVIVKDFLKK
jgi:O-antigen/teichoic acid export membrane protein